MVGMMAGVQQIGDLGFLGTVQVLLTFSQQILYDPHTKLWRVINIQLLQ